MRRALSTAALVSTLVSAARASAAIQAHGEPPFYAVRDVRLSLAEDAPRRTLLLRGGRIEAVLDPLAEIPPAARQLEGRGAAALPVFVDAYSRTGCATPAPAADRDLPPNYAAEALAEMRSANRKGLQPAFEAAGVLALEEKEREAWRERGFGALLSAPGGNLLAGTSALASLRRAAARDAILRPAVFAHGAFRADGPGYPGTAMGYMAQLRQFFLDASHQAELRLRYEQGRPGPRPAHDAELEAAQPLLGGTRRLMVEADSLAAIERWLRLADEFDLALAIAGGREAWRCADELSRRGIPVVLTLDWGDEVKDPAKDGTKDSAEKVPEAAPQAETPPAGTAPEGGASPADPEKKGEALSDYREPLGVALEKRRRWEERRDGALRLLDAGVPFAFGTGSGKPAELMKKLRQLVEAGLSREEALAALTRGAAEILGAERHLGRVEVGLDASFALWPADPFAKDARPSWVFIDGYPHELESEEQEPGDSSPPEKGLSAGGTWTLTASGGGQDPLDYELALEMAEDGAVTGTAVFTSPINDQPQEVELEGRLAGRTLSVSGSYTRGEFEVKLRFRLELQADQAEGELTVEGPRGPRKRTLSGSRAPGTGSRDASQEMHR